jgi:two-component system, NarL family, sensor histidine kinase UhpB
MTSYSDTLVSAPTTINAGESTNNALAAGILKALGIFLLVQAFFWVALSALERLSQPVGLANGGSVELTLSDAKGNYPPTQPKLLAQFDPWPYFYYIDRNRVPTGRFFVRFDKPKVEGPVGFYFNPGNTVESVYLNGQLLNARLNYSRWAGVDIFAPTVVILPDEILKATGNVIQIETSTRQRKHLAPFALGAAADLEKAAAWGALVSTYLPLAALAVMAFTLILCAITYWPKEDRPWINAFMILLVAWGACNVMALGLLTGVMPDNLFVKNLFTWSMIYWYQFAFLAFVLQWVRAPKKLQAWVWAAFAIVLSLAMVAHFWTNVFDAETGRRVSQELRKLLEHTVTIALGIGMTAILLVALATSKEKRVLETFLFLTGITAITVDAIDDRFRLHALLYPDLPLTFAIGPAAGLFMALGMCAALARYASDARRVVLTANETLQSRLAQRELEIGQAYEKERVLVSRQALLEERQRIVRDMHDGFAGQLIALTVQVRNDAVSRTEIAESLATSMTDLRLIVDSLDSAGESLDQALVSLRSRIAASLKAANIELIWSNRLVESSDAYGPQAILHVFRILQEAVSNALRHSHASVLEIIVQRPDDDPKGLEILVVDNGHGIGTDAPSGKGVGNMKDRAKRLGGMLTISSSSQGTRVSLKLPAGVKP